MTMNRPRILQEIGLQGSHPSVVGHLPLSVTQPAVAVAIEMSPVAQESTTTLILKGKGFSVIVFEISAYILIFSF